ncbi:MAG: hypothetical protein E2O85_01530 [Bacteroidetes bacterium]|nr:MAG: hypothetical protein E2O85_01530 [Bacteroidota bacterium]
MEIESQKIEKENVDNWTINPAYEIVPERGVVRLVKYKKEFSDDVMVLRDGVPFILKNSGRPLKANEVMRERADLALDKDGNLLPQGEFQMRYMEWLGAFVYPEGTELALEPVPEVSAYVSECQDTFSESTGWIEIGFDPKLNEEWEPSKKFDTEGRDRDEVERDAKSDMNTKIMEALVSKLSPEQAAELITEAVGVEIPVVGETVAEPVNVATHVQKPAKELLTAPCGKPCKGKAGLSAHTRFCKHELCGGDSENSHRVDESA